MRRVLRDVGLVVLLVLLAGGCQPVQTPSSENEGAKPPASAPLDFSLPTLSGTDSEFITLSAMKGQVILLDFWATWCPPCKYELPVLNRLYSSLQERGFVLVGMTVDRGELPGIASAVQDLELSYPAGWADEAVQAAFGGIRRIPTKVLIDRTGRIRETFEGLIPEEQLRTAIESLLAE